MPPREEARLDKSAPLGRAVIQSRQPSTQLRETIRDQPQAIEYQCSGVKERLLESGEPEPGRPPAASSLQHPTRLENGDRYEKQSDTDSRRKRHDVSARLSWITRTRKGRSEISIPES